MTNFEIQNHKGEKLSIVSADVMAELIEVGDLNYALHDPNPEFDMVTRLAAAKEEDPSLNLEKFRIYKAVVEEVE